MGLRNMEDFFQISDFIFFIISQLDFIFIKKSVSTIIERMKYLNIFTTSNSDSLS